MSVTITAFKADVNSKITTKTAPRSVKAVEHGGLLSDLADIVGNFFGDADTSTQPYLRLNYAAGGDTRIYSVGNLSTLVNTGNGLASYIGGSTTLGAFTAKHLTAKGGSLQVEGVASDARAILHSPSGYAPYLRFAENSTSRGVIGYAAGGTSMQFRVGASDMATGTHAVSIFSDGKLGFGTNTNAGYLADFNGTTRFQSHIYTGSSSNLYLGTTNAYIAGNGSATVSLYAFNGVLIGDFVGTVFNSAIASGSVTGSAIPRPLVVGSSTLSQCAAFQVVSTTRGFIPPKLDSTQRAAMTNLEDGVEIFNTTTGKKQTWVAGTWYDHF